VRGTELWSSNSDGGIPYLKGDSVLLVYDSSAVLLDGKTGKLTDFARNIYAMDKNADRICHIADTDTGFAEEDALALLGYRHGYRGLGEKKLF
jgi:hypothetical protein